MPAKKGQKGRKIGRNADTCKAYRNSNRRERNKAKKLLKHFKRYGFASAPAVHCYNDTIPMMVKPKGMLMVALEKPVGKRIKPAERMPPVRPKARG